MTEKAHTWRFRRIGGMDQVVLQTSADIEALAELDPKLWVVLAMPTTQNRCSDALKLLDIDHDGKVKTAEILGAIEKLKAAFTSLDVLFSENASIKQEFIKDKSLNNACKIAAQIAGSNIDEIDLDIVNKAIELFNTQLWNGDGVIVIESTDEPEVKEYIAALIAGGYCTQDSSGNMGVDLASIEAFRKEAQDFLSWIEIGEALKKELPFTDLDTALAAYKSVATIVDDYFQKCALLGLTGKPDALNALMVKITEALSSAPENNREALRILPLSIPQIDGFLDIHGPFNPFYEPQARAFFGIASAAYELDSKLERESWKRIVDDMEKYETWLAAKPVGRAQSIPPVRLKEMIQDSSLNKLLLLIEKDLQEAPRAEALRQLRDLLIIKRDFLKILRNFVTMDDFYATRKSIFQSGRLFLDGREFELCLDVNNPNAHPSLVSLSNMYLVYCDIFRTSGEKRTIIAGITAGEADGIYIGRNGIYIDDEGANWNATITRVLIQPISIREAFFSPYRWLARTIESLIVKRASTTESERQNQMKSAAEKTLEAPIEGPQVNSQAVAKKIDVGTVAAIGVALGSIGAMITSILSLFIGLGVWMPLGIALVFLLISGPSMILAAIKLRKRDLSPILNAEGWAVNGHLLLNIIFGSSLSHLATLPSNSVRTLNDPYAPKRKPWVLYLLILLIILAIAAWLLGWIEPIIDFFRK